MMFQLVLGRSGSGKTMLLCDRAAASARQGKKVLMLVPEQFSFETEKRMLSTLCGKSSLNLTVLSFSRLCENIFRTYGGLAGKRLDDKSRLVLMKLAIQEMSDTLELYGRQSRRTDFLTTMLQTVEELKSSGTYPPQLREAIAGMEDGQLLRKLTDITAIYEAYQGIVERNYQDPLDDITRAVGLAVGSGFFSEYEVYIDGFSFFSPPERRLIELMLEQSESVTLALCSDGLSEGDDLDIFHDQKAAARWFIRRCALSEIKCKKPIVLEQNLRTQNPALLAIEEFMALGNRSEGVSSNGFAILRGEDKYDEIRYAAAEITRLVREEGYRYRDVAVVCRSLSDYETALETIFAAYSIPLFFDKKEQVTSRPIISVVTAALDAVRGDWKTEAILRIARSPASGVSMEAAAALENYAYIWSLAGGDWATPFQNSPKGLSGTLSQDDRIQLEALEQLRNRLLNPLIKLKNSLSHCTGASFAMGIYNYLCDADVANNLREYYSTDENSLAIMEETDTLYSTLIDILDLFSDSMRETSFSVATYTEMLELAIDCIELGSIPNTNDQTIAGSADRIRMDSPKAVFAVGVNEGVFPAKYSPYGVFSDQERERLIESGIELSASRFQRALLERFFLYSTLCGAGERLYISYSAATLSGGQQEPSLIVGQLSGIFPDALIDAATQPTDFYVADLFTAREQYVRRLGAGLPTPELAEAIVEEGDGSFITLMHSLAEGAPAQGIQRPTAKALINGKLNLSPTKIESFFRCPYLYFCETMLRLRKRKKVEYTPLESGSAIHYVLEHLLRELSGKGISQLSDEVLEAKVSDLLTAYIATLTLDSSQLANRFKYQFQRLVSVLLMLLRHIGDDFDQSLFTAAGMEVTVASDGDVKPKSFTVGEGINLTVNGKIDRVDLFENGDERYARVVDYKSGGKDFGLDEVFYGLNMQMLIYLFALCDDKTGPFGEVKPAGILYMPGKVSAANITPNADQSLVRSIIDDTLQMKGLLLEDEVVLRAMERELAGRYIPVKTTKAGTLAASSKVKSAGEFELIKQTVAARVQEMGEALAVGKVAPLPVRGKGINPCDYCDYGVLCRNKNTAAFKDITLPPPQAAALNNPTGGDTHG
ncbi:MAG: PD-(D/E)XK nuclease family protein [Angelakisella sp.]